MIEGISFASIENISTLGDDVLEGTSANDKIIAQAGDDTLNNKKVTAINNIFYKNYQKIA